MYIKTGTEEEQLFRKLYYPPKAAVKFEIFPGLRVLGAFLKRNMSDLEILHLNSILGMEAW